MSTARRAARARRGHVQVSTPNDIDPVFANILMSPGGPDWEKALRLAMPSAVITGIEALRRVGWTTQVPHLPTVVVNAKQQIFKTDHFDVALREPSWFEITRPGLDADTPEQLPVLRPAWALADLLREHGWGACGLAPDDIDGSAITSRDERDWQLAAKALLIRTNPQHWMAPAQERLDEVQTHLEQSRRC